MEVHIKNWKGTKESVDWINQKNQKIIKRKRVDKIRADWLIFRGN